MKKLNRKGFTLIELLAIIVILAIIMVVTIPTVLSSMGTAREEMFQTSANTVADWVEKQYTYAMMQGGDAAFTTVCTATNKYCSDDKNDSDPSNDGYVLAALTDNKAIEDTNAIAFLKASGVDPTNYTGMSVFVTNGRACVKLTAAAGGDFDAYKGTVKSSTGC